MAHIDLAKAEAQSIGDEIKRVAALAGIAFAVVVFAVILAVVGTALFLGEWLLGSIGWGVLHGLLLFTAIAVACGLAAVGVSGGRIGRGFVLGLIVAVVVGVGLALALPNQAYASLGESALPGIEPGVRPLVVGLLVGGAIGLLVGVIGALRGGGVAAVVGGAVVGLLLGALSAVNVGPQVGVGIGIALGYIVWIAVMGMDVARSGVDVEALKARFYPKQTIETSKETLAWLQSKMPPGTGS
jgi:MFS family permease